MYNNKSVHALFGKCGGSFRNVTNSEEEGTQSASHGFLDEKIETPNSEEFQIHSFSTNSTFSKNSESDLKEEKGDVVDDSNPGRSTVSALRDASLVKEEETG